MRTKQYKEYGPVFLILLWPVAVLQQLGTVFSFIGVGPSQILVLDVGTEFNMNRFNFVRFYTIY
jgi:hypothetical protein